MSYSFSVFREWEISHYGQTNKFGIEYAPKEFCLRIFEILADFGIFIFTVIHFTNITNNELSDAPLLYYWIIIDMIIMFLTLPYTYMSKLMMLTGEIAKNVFTLYQV